MIIGLVNVKGKGKNTGRRRGGRNELSRCGEMQLPKINKLGLDMSTHTLTMGEFSSVLLVTGD
jgi:hypothetical protein